MDSAFPFIGIAITVLSLAVSAFVVWRVLGPLLKRSAAARAIVATGEPAQARVLQIAQTGTYVNDQPEVSMLLEVHRAGQAPYQTQHTTIVSVLLIPRVQPGCTLPVRVDRTDPRNVALVAA